MKHIVVAMAVICLSGCASITGSKNQPISVQSYLNGDEIEGAKCSLVNDKGSWFVTTPGSVLIQKSYSDLIATCRRKGSSTGTVTVSSSANGGTWGNLLAGGPIGYAIDASSGAGFNYPTNINVELGKSIVLKPQPAQPVHGKKANP